MEERPSDMSVKLAMKLGKYASPGVDYLDVMMMARDMVRGGGVAHFAYGVAKLARLRWPEGEPVN